MKAETKSKQWITPELIVVVRSKPEEAVLAACKFTNSAGGGGGVTPGVDSQNCKQPGNIPCVIIADS